MIQTIKRTVKKAHESSEDIYLALLALNTSPGSDECSPTWKLFNRHVRSPLPSITEKLPVHNNGHDKKDSKSLRHRRDLPDIEPDATVRIRTDKERNWKEKGRVVGKCTEPRAYNVLNSKGNIVRRNRRHLMPTNEPFAVKQEHESDVENGSNEVPEGIQAHGSDNVPEKSGKVNNGGAAVLRRSSRISRMPLRYGFEAGS